MNKDSGRENLCRTCNWAKDKWHDSCYCSYYGYIFSKKDCWGYERKEDENEQLTIIGNLTKEPELRTTNTGKEVCSFTVAVNRRKTPNNQEPGADFFHVSAWEERGRTCKKYLHKGSKVCVVGTVSVRAYTNNQGEATANLEVKADDVEFLSPKNAGTIVEDSDDPFAGR